MPEPVFGALEHKNSVQSLYVLHQHLSEHLPAAGRSPTANRACPTTTGSAGRPNTSARSPRVSLIVFDPVMPGDCAELHRFGAGTASFGDPVEREMEITDQIGVVINDLHKTIKKLHKLLESGPFKVLEWPMEGVDPQATYHGEPGSYKLLLGFASSGSLNIELVEPLDGDNIYSDFMKTHGPGLHHIRLNVPDFEEMVAAWEQAGIKNMASGTGVHPGSKWAYFDTTSLLDGVIIELRKRLE